jgi:hypothetical protein
MVGFLGDFNTGKSLLLSKLAGLENDEHWQTNSTVGINFTFVDQPEAKQIYFIDIAGSS